MITFPLSYLRPPLTTNGPSHRMQKYRLGQDIQQEAQRLARKLYRHQPGYTMGVHNGEFMDGEHEVWTFPIDYPVELCLVWTVTTKHVRDADAGDPTRKAFQDGLVKASLFTDDRHEIITRSYCRIEHGQRMGLRVEITPVKGDEQ